MIMIKKYLSLLDVEADRIPAFRDSLGYIPIPQLTHKHKRNSLKRNLFSEFLKKQKVFRFSRFRRIKLKGQ